MKSHNKVSILALTLGLTLAGSANAALEINDGSTPIISEPVKISAPVVQTSFSSGNVSQIGTPVISAPLRGWANDIGLGIALKQITPAGWKAKKLGTVNLEQPVSWKGDKPWVDVLGDMSRTYGFKAVVDWNTREVTVSNSGSVPSSSLVSSSTTTPTGGFFSGSTKNTSITTTKIGSPVNNSVISYQPVSVSQTWLFSKDKTLRENIESWARQAGWVVSWDAPDYKNIADITLSGAIDAPDGPIARVISAYKDAKEPLVVKISTGNKVIRVESKTYRQETVVGQSMNETFKDLSTR